MVRPRIVCEFGVRELAEICGCSDSAIFHHIAAERLVLDDLVSVTKFIAARARDDIRMEIGYAYGRLGEYGPPTPSSKNKESQEKMKTNASKKKKPKQKIDKRLE